jgi:Xaa-Pro aminopeptidase
MIDDGIVILPTSPEYYRNRDSKFPFRADSDFYYLTQFPEPEAVAVLEKSSGKFILFCRDKDPLKEQWDGYRIGQDEAISHYGADEAYSFNDIDVILPTLMQNQSRVYCTLGRYPVFDKQLIDYLNDMRGQNIRDIHIPLEFVDVGHILHEIALFKKPMSVN